MRTSLNSAAAKLDNGTVIRLSVAVVLYTPTEAVLQESSKVELKRVPKLMAAHVPQVFFIKSLLSIACPPFVLKGVSDANI